MRNPMNNEMKIPSTEIKSSRLRTALLSAGMLILTALFLSACGNAKKEEAAKAEAGEKAGEHKEGVGEEVSLSSEALAAAKLEFAEITARAGGGVLRVTGSVEVNQQQMQQATPLVSGRVERVNVALGDRVRVGQPLAMIASPQIAQMHGKLHEAETKFALAQREYTEALAERYRALADLQSALGGIEK